MSNENFYPGTSYPLEEGYRDVLPGYSVSASSIGMATDPRTANQLQEVSMKINPGGKTIEISAVNTQAFESIPQQHLKEINRLTKLTGTEVTLHAPAIEPSGYTEGGKWSEANRQQSENQMMSAVERGHVLNSKGNMPVTFHPSYMLPEERVVMKEEGKEMPKSMIAADTRTGELIQIKETEKFFPEKGGLKEEFNPEEELKKRNEESWIQALNSLNWYAMRGEEQVRESLKPFEEGGKKEAAEEILRIYKSEEKEKILENFPEEIKKNMMNVFRNLDQGTILLKDSYNNLRELYNRVYKDANPEDKPKLEAYAASIKKEVESGIENNPEKLKRFAEMIERGVHIMKEIKSPNLFQPLNKFLIDKNSETFSNVAFNAYKKFGDKAPTISIENPPAGGALSRAEELKDLIERTRKKFIEKAKKEGIGESQAKEAAEKLIGATWDVGHINMIRKYGYDKVDLIKETEKIAPFVKHVHLSDNFGFEHTELPMGMGNVPIQEMLKKLGDKGEKVKKIIEAGNWFQFFKTPPLAETYENLGTPLFPMKAPYWNQIASAYGNYFSFPSAYFTEQHMSTYGTGFSGLPQELGGQIPGRQSRFAGSPNA